MKRFILMMFAGVFSCISYSQSGDTLKVHQGTYTQSLLLSNVDSITHDGDQFVSIYHDEQMSSYSVENIDSIVIRPALGGCYQILEEQLNGWDEGVYYSDLLDNSNSFYVVSHSDPEDGTRTVFLEEFSNNDITHSIALVFSPNSEIHDIFISGYQFEAYQNEEYVTFLAYDKDGNAIDSFEVPYEENSDNTSSSARASSPRKAIEHYRIVNLRNFLGKAGKLMWNTADIEIKLEDGKYADILKDYLIGKLAGQVAKSFLGELTLAQLIDMYLKQLYENNKNWFMGSASIEITSIKRANKSTINVEGAISNISTIPSTRLVASEYPNYIDDKVVYLKEVPNYVLYGVAEGKSGQPGLYLHDKCTTPVVVSGNHFSCSLPVDYKPGQTFYFRPFLVPASQFEESADFGQAVGKMIASNVRYGNRKDFTDKAPACSTGEVLSTAEKSAIVKCSYSGAEGFECGVMVSSDNGTKSFPTSSEDGERSVNLSGLSPATTYNYWAYVDVDGEPINGVVKSFTTKDRDIPDLSGTWTFNQSFLGSHTVYPNLKLSSSNSKSATYKASGFYGVISFSMTVASDGSASITLSSPYGQSGHFSGKFNDDFTSISGDSYIYDFGPNNWAVPPTEYEEPWSLSR